MIKARAAALRLVASLTLLGSFAGGAWGAGLGEPAADPRQLVEQALAFEHGEGVPRAPEHAAELYCEAVRLGNAEAMYNLGWMYANGRGVARDDAYAATLFEMALFKGHPGAEKGRRLVGEYTGDVPDCLKPTVARYAFAATRENWDTQKYLASLPERKKRVVELITTLAPRFSIEPRLALAIATTESNFDINATSPKNAMGVMQLIPETSERFNVKNPYDPAQNIRGGLTYLRWLLAYFEGDVALVAAAYNAGEGKVERYRGVPPYLETRAYVQRILKAVGATAHPFDRTVAPPSPALERIRLALRRK